MALTEEQNPPELLAPLDDPMVVSRRWCVAYTRSRMEKRLAWHLARMGIPYFLPMVTEYTVSRNRVKNVLFRGTLFMTYLDNDESLDLARQSRCVAKFLFTDNQPRLRQELALLASERPERRTLRLEDHKLQAGDAVKIASGPMMGLEGRVGLSPGSREPRFFVELGLLGQLVSVEINPQLVEAL